MRFAALLLVATMAVGCGGNPTQPTTVTAPPAVTSQTGEPAPPPPPAPGLERWQGTGTIATAHWYESPVLPDSFKVNLNRETLTFGTLTAAVLAWEQKETTVGVFARPSGMNLQIVLDASTGKGTWTLSGEPGQATGTLAVEK